MAVASAMLSARSPPRWHCLGRGYAWEGVFGWGAIDGPRRSRSHGAHGRCSNEGRSPWEGWVWPYDRLQAGGFVLVGRRWVRCGVEGSRLSGPAADRQCHDAWVGTDYSCEVLVVAIGILSIRRNRPGMAWHGSRAPSAEPESLIGEGISTGGFRMPPISWGPFLPEIVRGKVLPAWHLASSAIVGTLVRRDLVPMPR